MKDEVDICDQPTCKQCGLPCMLIPHLGIVKLNKDEECDYCRHYHSFRDIYKFNYQERKKSFDKIIEAQRNKSQYDCIVLFTGGKDSVYTLYLLSKEYNLNVLALTWDNGFFSENTIKNINATVENLKVQHEYVRTDWDVLKDIYKNRLRNYGRFCECGPLSILFSAPIIYETKTPLVFYSNSFSQMIAIAESIAPIRLHSKKSALILKYVLSIMGFVPIKSIINSIYYVILIDIVIGTLSEQTLKEVGSLYSYLNKLMNINDIFFMHPACYFEWDTKVMLNTIKRYGWTMPKEKNGISHTSCIMEELKGYLAFRQNIINFDLLEICAGIRNQKTPFNNFSNIMKRLGYVHEEPGIFEEFLKRVDMSREEIYGIINKKLGRRKRLPEINKNSLKYLPISDSLEVLRQNLIKAYKTKILI